MKLPLSSHHSPLTWRGENFHLESNTENLQANLDTLDDIREAAHLSEYAVKQRASQRYDSKAILQEMKKGDLILRKMIRPYGAGIKASPQLGRSLPSERKAPSWGLQTGRTTS